MTATAELSGQDAKRKLPDGWQWARLGDLTELTGGDGAPQEMDAFANGTVPFVRMKDVGRYRFTLDLVETDECLTEEAIKKFRMRIFPAGTILMPRSGSVYTNHRARLGVPAAVVGHLAALLPHDEVFDSSFVTLALKLVDMRQWMSKTTGLDSIGFKELSQVLIPLPPLAEQKRIAGILQKQMAAVERARASAEAQLQAAENLPAAHLRAVFDSDEAQSWERKNLAEVCTISTGTTPSRLRPDYFGEDIPWVTPGDFDGSIYISEGRESLSKLSIQICEALEHVHSKGIIHRDIKPENFIVLGSEIRMIDFGIAKLKGEDVSGRPMDRLTLTNEFVGPLFFSSPEMIAYADDKSVPVDHRSDLFQMGKVLWFIATGQISAGVPSAKKCPHKGRFHGIVSRLLNDDPDDRQNSANTVREQFVSLGKATGEVK